MRIEPRLLIGLTCAFIGATIVGTLTHEAGHYLAAIWMGYQAEIHYGSTGIIQTSSPHSVGRYDHIWFLLGGVTQTLITGITGCILVWYNRHRFQGVSGLRASQWLMIFLALFWLRQPANLVTWIGGYIMHGTWARRSDEVRLALYFDWPVWSISAVTACAGLAVLYWITFQIVPAHQRVTFLASGIIGGVSGYALWFGGVGQWILP